MDGLAFLQNPGKASPQPIYVLAGEEAFLKRHILAALRNLLIGDVDSSFAWSVFAGDKASYGAVLGELTTLPFVGDRRVVVVDAADPFVSAARDKLEKYVSAPARTGVLILDVKSWPATTKLAKMVADKSTLVCKTPAANRLPDWCRQWCADQHGKTLSAPAAKLLVDLVGPDMGMLDQELAKLAAYAGSTKQIDAKDVDQLVGNNREEDVWQIFALITSGKTADALTILDRLLVQGEEPLRLLGAMSSRLRGFAQTYRLTTTGQSVRQAMDDAGVPANDWVRRNMEDQMRQLGGRRLNRIYDLLLGVNMGIKGASQLPPRAQLERLVIQLVQQ